jgi:hypothetical protein
LRVFVTPLLPDIFSKVHEGSSTKLKSLARFIIAPKGNVKPFKTYKKMGVHLREKKLGGGQVSFYLDIYHSKRRWYEFLEIHINKSRPSPQDKEKRRLAQEIRSKRENELIVEDNGLTDKSKRKADFTIWFEKFLSEKPANTLYSSTLYNLRNYIGKKPLPFVVITPEWCKDFVKHLKTKVSNNTARKYAMVVFSGLEEAQRKGIIQKNPFRLIDKKDRIKKQEIFRNAYTLEELQSMPIKGYLKIQMFISGPQINFPKGPLCLRATMSTFARLSLLAVMHCRFVPLLIAQSVPFETMSGDL